MMMKERESETRTTTRWKKKTRMARVTYRVSVIPVGIVCVVNVNESVSVLTIDFGLNWLLSDSDGSRSDDDPANYPEYLSPSLSYICVCVCVCMCWSVCFDVPVFTSFLCLSILISSSNASGWLYFLSSMLSGLLLFLRSFLGIYACVRSSTTIWLDYYGLDQCVWLNFTFTFGWINLILVLS